MYPSVASLIQFDLCFIYSIHHINLTHSSTPFLYPLHSSLSTLPFTPLHSFHLLLSLHSFNFTSYTLIFSTLHKKSIHLSNPFYIPCTYSHSLFPFHSTPLFPPTHLNFNHFNSTSTRYFTHSTPLLVLYLARFITNPLHFYTPLPLILSTPPSTLLQVERQDTLCCYLCSTSGNNSYRVNIDMEPITRVLLG